MEIISFGQPVVKEGSNAPALVKNMKQGFDRLRAQFLMVFTFILAFKKTNAAYALQEGTIMYSYDTLQERRICMGSFSYRYLSAVI